MPAAIASRGDLIVRFDPLDPDLPGNERLHAEQKARQRAATAAEEACCSEHLSPMNDEIDVSRLPCSGGVAQFDQRFAVRLSTALDARRGRGRRDR